MTSASPDTGSSATEVRDLRTGVPVWASYLHARVPSVPLIAPLKADVVIVGAGITGALLALETTLRGLSTVVLDRREPAHGSTAASTALLQWEIDTPLIKLADSIGFEQASRAWQRCFRAVDAFAGLVRRHSIRCDFAPRRALYLAGNTLSATELAEEGRMPRSIGLPSTFLAREGLHGLAGVDREAALLSDGAADVDPVGITAGVLQRAAHAGARICSPVQLAEVQPSSSKVAMVTAGGIEIEARALVFATGYELADGIPTAGHKRTSTWAFATPPQPRALWSGRELIWEASEPYLYVRTTADGRVVVGGEDEDFSDEQARDALSPAKIRALQIKAKRLFPNLDVTADFAWAGTFGESDNGMPSIGPVPDMPNCHAILGYGGNGITFGLIAAQVIAARLVGQTDPDADLFEFERRRQ